MIENNKVDRGEDLSFSGLCSILVMLFVLAAIQPAPAQIWAPAGDNYEDYEIGGDPTVEHGGDNCGFIRSIKTPANGFGSLMTTIDAGEYCGQGLCLSAYLRTRDVKQGVGLWMRVENNGEVTAFDNMGGRMVEGTTEWQQYSVTLDVEDNSRTIHLGVLLMGRGEVMVDGLTLTPTERSWTAQQSATWNRLYCVQALDEMRVYAAGENGNFFKTVDGGESWRKRVPCGGEHLSIHALSVIDSTTIFLVGTGANDSRICKSIDGGENWSVQYQDNRREIVLSSIAFWDERCGVAVGNPIDGAFLILTTTDGGSHWKAVPADNCPSPLEGESAGFAGGGTYLTVQGCQCAWFGTGQEAANQPLRIIKTTDGGQTWTAVNTPLARSRVPRGITTIAFKDSLVGFAGCYIGGTLDEAENYLVKTTDGGESWKCVDDFPAMNINTLSYVPDTEPSVLFFTSMQGAGYSVDAGNTWQCVPSTQIFYGVSFSGPASGWAVGQTGGIHKSLYNFFPTRVANSSPLIAPIHCSLEPNFPNPFNASTLITYRIASSGPYTIDVYDMLGRWVDRLADGYHDTGNYKVLWDGTNADNLAVPSGIYVCRLAGKDLTRIIKLTMIR